MDLRASNHLIHQSLLRESLLKGNGIRLQALGRSMWPFIHSGDRLQVMAVDRFSDGDILLYERGDVWFIHRLLRQTRDAGGERTLILRGDANKGDDPPTAESAVLGRVVKIEHGSRILNLDGRRAAAYGFAMRRPLLRNLLYSYLFSVARRMKQRLNRPASR